MKIRKPPNLRDWVTVHRNHPRTGQAYTQYGEVVLVLSQQFLMVTEEGFNTLVMFREDWRKAK